MDSPFEELGLQPQLVQAVEQMGFEQPTPIQQEAIPVLLEGRNVMGQAQTGTGKTAAFALPMLQNIETGKGVVQALVLAPTRELVMQVADATGRMARNTSLRVMAIYGGQAYRIQTRQLERGVDVVVGTPGRLLDLIHQKLLDLSQVHYLVIDEADEMLEMGFIEDVESILSEVPQERQTALFSATLPQAVRKLADRYLTDPHRIVVNPVQLTVAETEQRYFLVREEQKFAALARLLEMEDVKSALVFTRTRARAQELADELIGRGYPAEALHGDMTQPRREFVLKRFRQGAIKLLVATDVAARGLDINDISHVFNYDLPGDSEDYVHRIGRTGRAGKKGIAITFATRRERRQISQIENYTKQAITECKVPTREDMQAKRDERFMQRLYDQLSQGDLTHERQMVGWMAQGGYDPADVAAAVIRMARAGEGELPAEEISAPAEARSFRKHSDAAAPAGEKRNYRSSHAAREDGRPSRKHEPGMVRLKMNLGNEHGLRPGDVVGAIASEVGIPGKAIGDIQIQRTHTFVDVSEKHVRRVLRESSGKYFLHGMPVMLTLAN